MAALEQKPTEEYIFDADSAGDCHEGEEALPLLQHLNDTAIASAPYTNTSYYSSRRLFSGFLPLTCLFLIGVACGIIVWPIILAFLSARYMRNSSIQHISIRPRNTTLPPDVSKEVYKDADGWRQVPPVLFNDIAGMAEAKAELAEFVHYLKNPEPYKRLGARLPKGILLIGPPGSGKTMLANAVANEAGIPYLYISGSEFVEIYVGQGARRVRHLFNVARRIAPCLLFIDELDAVGGRRSTGMGTGGHREHDQTLNQLLVELDGFNSTSGIMVLAATNRVDSLDPALLRPGRFDRIVRVGLPDIAGRKAILNTYLARVPFNGTEDTVHVLAKMTPGFSGAELENLVNEAALTAAHMGKETVSEKELSDARDKVSMGPERRSLVVPEKQREVTAYHEAGHAIIAFYLQPDSDPIHKVTIVSRGNALGLVEQIPPEDRFGQARAQLEARLAVSMGGRAAEELVFGKSRVSNGASSDILMATAMAYKMVTEWGMSDKLGPLNYKLQHGTNGMMSSVELSGATASLIEEEVRNLVLGAMKKAADIMKKHRTELDLLAYILLEEETLTGERVAELLNTKEKESSVTSFFGYLRGRSPQAIDVKLNQNGGNSTSKPLPPQSGNEKNASMGATPDQFNVTDPK